MARATTMAGMKVKGQPQRLVLVSPPHPATTALLWFFCAAAVVLFAWIAGSGLQVDCARARENCFVISPNGMRTELREGDFRQVRVAAEGRDRHALVVSARGNMARVASTPLVRKTSLEQAASAIEDFFAGRTDVVFLTFRNWLLASEVGGPFAVIALLIAVVRRRRLRVTLEWTADDLAFRKQTLLSTAHAPIHTGKASVSVEGAQAPLRGAQRLILTLQDGRSFPVTQWSQDGEALRLLKEKIEAFFAGTRSR